MTGSIDSIAFIDAIDKQLVYTAAAAIVAVVAAIFDIKSRRVPNRLTGPAILLALAVHFAFDGFRGIGNALAAGLICGTVFLVFYLAGGMGAGDVKLIAAAGAFAGLSNVALLLVFTALAGGVMALALAVSRGRLRETLSNVSSLASHHAHAGLTPHPDIHVRNRNQLRLPYAVAIAAGCLVTLWLQTVQA